MLPSTTTLTTKQASRLNAMCPAGHNALMGTTMRGVQTDLVDMIDAVYGPGLVLYVDGANGLDNTVSAPNRYPKSKVNWGTTWDTAFKTIQAALVVARGAGTGSNPALDSNYDQDHCVTVIVAPGNYAENLIMVGAGVRLLGLGYSGTDRGVSITPADQSGTHPGSMIIQGSGMEVANLLLINDYAYPTVWFDNMHSSWVHDLVFYGNGTATVAFTTNGMKNSIFERNRISMFSAAGFERNGSADYMIGSVIRDNYIGCGTGTGILIDAGMVMYDAYVHHNRIEGNGLTLGIDNNCTGHCLITENEVMITANTIPIESASTNGGVVSNEIVYHAGAKIVNHYKADA